jgi:leucyl aminopeptidase
MLSAFVTEPPAGGVRKVLPVRPEGLASALAALPTQARNYATQAGFSAETGELLLLPGGDGIGAALLGLGDDRTPFVFGDLPNRLPAATVWGLEPGDYDPEAAVLGFGLGAYRFISYKSPKRPPALLLLPEGTGSTPSAVAATWMVRDLVNTPANALGPAELAGAAARLAADYGATFAGIEGPALAERFPVLAAVGAGSGRPPEVAILQWRGSRATETSPLVSVVGKGVCFDTGGYDLKPSSSMLWMKKDMGGAAHALGLARLVMAADLPVQLAVRIGCVENSVSGNAMRPSDVLRSRYGLSIEVGNTDAEGLLVLCDLLAEAGADSPSLLLDFATLTGAARVALGPDLPALFCNDDALAAAFEAAGRQVCDPVWRLPLWPGYQGWLDSNVADTNNVSLKPHAGAVTAALFLQRFVRSDVRWAHVDLYAWNDNARPGRPEGGEAQAMRAAFATIRNTVITPQA